VSVSRPPSGIASRAFTPRLSSAISNWCGSAIAGGKPGGRSSPTATCGPLVLASSSLLLASSRPISLATSTSCSALTLRNWVMRSSSAATGFSKSR